MFDEILKFFSEINPFDVAFCFLTIYFIIQCYLKGFSLSFISFMKWIFSIVVTIVLVPKLRPWISEYIESDFVNSVGLGAFVFIVTLFITILIGRALGRAVTWTGMGSIDKREDVNVVMDDFMLATAADIVADPSAPDAFVNGIMEGKEWAWDNGILKETEVAKYQSYMNNATRKNLEERTLRVFEHFLSGL